LVSDYNLKLNRIKIPPQGGIFFTPTEDNSLFLSLL
jgi:hypothetical protein